MTNEHDVGTDLVVRELRRRAVPYLRLNTERLAARRFSWDGCRAAIDDAALTRIESVLLRQPVWPAFEDASAAERDVLQNQWRAAVRGLSALGARWVNPLDAGLAAESKMRQLSVAHDVGFAVPETLVTNDMAAAADFCDAHGGAVVAKGLDAPYVEDPDRPRFVFTSVVNSATLRARARVDAVPMIFQRLVEPKTDLRVTVVGASVFGTVITPPDGTVDWRVEGRRARLEPHQPCARLVDRCRSFLGELGLAFGAFDFAVHGGVPLFLECNQNGEWGWIEQATGAPIAAAVAEELAS